MKKIIAILLTCALLLGLGTAAAASESESRDTQAMLGAVKARIGSTEEYDEFESSSYGDENGVVYNFIWSGEDGARNLYVSVNDKGIVTSYDVWDQSRYEQNEKIPMSARPSLEEALENARAFVKRINPSIADELAVTVVKNSENLYNRGFYFPIQRLRDGIPVDGDGGNIQLSGDGKTVEYFYVSYTDGIEFESSAKTITPEQAEKAFAEKLGMELGYTIDYSGRDWKIKPCYTPNEKNGSLLSAVTGELIRPIYPSYDTARGKYMTEATAGAPQEMALDSGFNSFSIAEQSELDQVQGLIPAEEIEKALRENEILQIPADYVRSFISRNKMEFPECYELHLSFRGEDGSVSVTVDGMTGRVISFSRYLAKTAEKPLMTEQQAKDAAEAAAVKLAGDVFSEYRREDREGVAYTRYVNGIPYRYDSITAAYSTETGLLDYYNCSYSDVEFPSIEGCISKEAATEALFRQTDYVLRYVFTCSKEGISRYDRAILVYVQEPYIGEMDAFTGDVPKTDLGELPEYTDIAGHYAEEAILNLRRFGIGFSEETYAPNRVITQGEYLELLNSIFHTESSLVLLDAKDHSMACKNAVRDGIVKEEELQEDAPLTREMAAVLLVRAMGMEKIASLDGIYQSVFTDVTSHVGHISILFGLGVLQGTGKGLFSPAKQLTRGAAAVVLNNYLMKVM